MPTQQTPPAEIIDHPACSSFQARLELLRVAQVTPAAVQRRLVRFVLIGEKKPRILSGLLIRRQIFWVHDDFVTFCIYVVWSETQKAETPAHLVLTAYRPGPGIHGDDAVIIAFEKFIC